MKSILNRIWTVLLVVLLSFSTLTIFNVKAQSEILWVPNMYPTIQDAIEAANNGDKIYLRGGNHDGPQNQSLVIDKSISIVGETAQTAILRLHPALVPQTIFTQTFWIHENPIQIKTNDVKIQGLTIISDGGTLSITDDSIKIDNNIINIGITARGNRIEIKKNTITSGRILLTGSKITISQNDLAGISDISCEGSNFLLASNNITGSSISVDGSYNMVYGNIIHSKLSIEGNSNLVARNFIKEGALLEGSYNVACSNRISSGISIVRGIENRIYGNEGFTPYGIVLRYVNDTAFYHNNFIVGQDFELRFWETGVGPILWNKDGEGNYWSNYEGLDINADGIGDTSYVINALDRNVTSLYPEDGNDGMPYRIHEPKIKDNYPLMKPIEISTVSVEIPKWVSVSLPAPIPMPDLDFISTSSPTPPPTITPNPQLEFPAIPVIASVSILSIVVIGIFVYFKKRRNKPK